MVETAITAKMVLELKIIKNVFTKTPINEITGFLRTAYRPFEYCVPTLCVLRTVKTPLPLNTADKKGGVNLDYDLIHYLSCCMQAFELKSLHFEWKLNVFMNMPEKKEQKKCKEFVALAYYGQNHL